MYCKSNRPVAYTPNNRVICPVVRSLFSYHIVCIFSVQTLCTKVFWKQRKRRVRIRSKHRKRHKKDTYQTQPSASPVQLRSASRSESIRSSRSNLRLFHFRASSNFAPSIQPKGLRLLLVLRSSKCSVYLVHRLSTRWLFVPLSLPNQLFFLTLLRNFHVFPQFFENYGLFMSLFTKSWLKHLNSFSVKDTSH